MIGEKSNAMAFMERQVVFGTWLEVDSAEGIVFIPVGEFEITPDMMPRDWWTIEVLTGYGARLSAPGYLDCTEWTVFGTEAEAHQFLEDFYPEDEEDTE